MTTGRSSETAMWTVVLASAALVVGLAVFNKRQERRSGASAAVAKAIALRPLQGSAMVALPQGKVTLVDFWATWCAPCRASMPRLQNLWKDYAARGVELYSVNTDDESPNRKPQVQEFLLQNQLSFPVVLDDEDKTASDSFRVSALPTLLVIDKAGKVVWSRIGALGAGEERELRGVLDEALRKG
jgi:thiol-disulfide isomerase/thioredoxin